MGLKLVFHLNKRLQLWKNIMFWWYHYKKLHHINRKLKKLFLDYWLFPKKCKFWQFLVDFPLFPANTGIPLLFTVKTNNFTSEKVGRTSGELQKKPILGIQSYHLRSAKIPGSTGWNCLGPQIMPWEAPNDPKTFHMDRMHHHESFEPTLGLLRHPQWSKRTNSTP